MFETAFKSLFGDSSGSSESYLKRTVGTLVIWGGVSLIWIFIYSLCQLQIEHWKIYGVTKALSVFGYGGLMAIAFAAIGGLFGFLFGIPRSIQNEAPKSTNPSQTPSSSKPLGVNTNLEQISDWLTKILIGVGLTALNNIPKKIWALADLLKGGLNDNQGMTVLVTLNFFVCGFFAGYLLTRLFLSRAFSEVEGAEVALKIATTLTATGEYKGAVTTLESSLLLVTDDTPKPVKKSVYEQLSYNYLYQAPPDGYTKALRLALKFIDEEGPDSSARIWANLAFAYGQQFEWVSDHEKDEEKKSSLLAQSRRNALDAINQALRLEPRMIGVLRMVWDPNDPTKISAEEDDLEVFHDDEEFKKLLGDKK